MATNQSTLPLKGRLFYVIRFHDIELAEDFIRRCPDVTSVRELNQFFHGLLSQYNHDTAALRALLQNGENFDYWQCQFVDNILPSLKAWRFPAMTQRNIRPIYETVSPQPAMAY